MTNIDWRAFWASFATIIICLVIYGIVIEPVIKRYRIQVVKFGDEGEPKSPSPTKTS